MQYYSFVESNDSNVLFNFRNSLETLLNFGLNGISDVLCSSFTCSDGYSQGDGTAVCADSGCTDDLCCDKDGENIDAYPLVAQPLSAHSIICMVGVYMRHCESRSCK